MLFGKSFFLSAAITGLVVALLVVFASLGSALSQIETFAF
jgi:hypothetical protein